MPTVDIKVKQLEKSVDELQSELEVKLREIDKLRYENKTLISKYIQLKGKDSTSVKEKDSTEFSQPSMPDLQASRNENNTLKENEGPKEKDLSQSFVPKSPAKSEVYNNL